MFGLIAWLTKVMASPGTGPGLEPRLGKIFINCALIHTIFTSTYIEG